MIVDLMEFSGGRVCCICFEGKLISELEPVTNEINKVWDVCKDCADNEKKIGAIF